MGNVSPPFSRPGPLLRPAGWIAFFLGFVAGASWLAALFFTVDSSALLPFIPDAIWARLAIAAVLLAVAPVIALRLVGIKRQLRRDTFARVVGLILLGLVPAAFAMTQIPQAGATISMESFGSVVFFFIISSPMFSLGAALAALTVNARDMLATPTNGWKAPVVLAACGFGAISIALGVLGVISNANAPQGDCTGQRLGCGVMVNTIRDEVSFAVTCAPILLFVLALLEGMLGYWLATTLTNGQGYGRQTSR